jgi:hypothetical protein
MAGASVEEINKALEEFIPKAMPLFDIAGQADAQQHQADAEEVKAAGPKEKPSEKDPNTVDAVFTEIKEDK